MKFFTRKLIKPEELNPRGTVFGGNLLKWMDEDIGIQAMVSLESKDVVTKFISQIDFVCPAFQGDILQIGSQLVSVGTTSITFCCEIKNIPSQEVILRVDKIVLVKVDNSGKAIPHNKTKEEISLNFKKIFQTHKKII